MKGLVIELITLIALLAGVFAAMHFSGWTAGWLSQRVSATSEQIQLGAFAITFVIVVILVFLLGKALEKVVNLLQLSFFNKLGGAVFGALKAAFILSAIIYLLNTLDPKNVIISSQIRDNSLLFKPVEKVAPIVLPRMKSTLEFVKQETDSTLVKTKNPE